MALASKGLSSPVIRSASVGVSGERRMPERLLLIATILIGFPLPLLLYGDDITASGGSPITLVLWALLYVIAFIGLRTEHEKAMRLVRASLPVLLIIAVAFISTLWSELPMQSLKESVALLGSSAIALFFVCRLGIRAFIGSLGIGLGICALLSVLFVAHYPGLGKMYDETGSVWRGAFITKNLLGEGIVLGILTIGCIEGLPVLLRRSLQIAALSIFPILLIGSRNAGSWVAFALVLLLAFVLLWSRKAKSAKLAITVGVFCFGGIVAAVLAGLDSDKLLDLLGKDQTLSGRADLWQMAINAVADQPLQGYGYSAFFDPTSYTGQQVQRIMPWANSAHNGYLESMLEFGAFGTIFLVATLVVGVKRAFAYFWRSHDRTSLWPILVMGFLIIAGLSEATLARSNDVRWIVFLAAFLYATDQARLEALPSEGTIKTGHR